ncbi:MAG: PAS domain-containing protein [Acidobacteriota bacterium]
MSTCARVEARRWRVGGRPTPLSGRPHRILLVDDAEMDAHVFRRSLDRAGVQAEVEWVRSAESALDRLGPQGRGWDLVVVDQDLPRMSGLQLCQVMLDSEVVVPFIMTAGEESQAVAVAALKAGVSDFLNKSQPDHADLLPVLVPQVIMKGGERQRRRAAERALRESQRLFQAFMNNSPALAYIKDEDGRYVYANQLFGDLFGVDVEVSGLTDFNLWPAETARQLREHDREVLESQETLQFMETVPHEDGDHHWLAMKFPLADGSGRLRLGGMAIDITGFCNPASDA